MPDEIHILFRPRVLAVHSSAKEQEVARFSERTKITGIVFLCAATR